ncbi:cyclic nucleotide-binding domain-containing protein [Pseudanabaena sp. FACHB-2040]|uniref:cyclic nucleotide-binding domain-containing protein n=1 Tax=Pseudanabaena sp. FACHB-2040 TaxID=2692859 RepID=UPI00168948E8|nr:cyclic nucleotide-binding domain-containing protein [Pseudanabaena sp. FACHB-2040]MBD2259730.1 cyclic nucleotide-binding domain-containing protein [Pseudanabaena sp. FACHB-2040]
MRNSLLLLGELSDEDVDWLRHSGERVSISAGGVLIQEGQPITALYLLLDGTLEVKTGTLGPPDQQRTVAHLATGEVIGEMSFVDNRPPSATVIAETDIIVLSVSQEQLLERADTDLAFGKRFYRGLAFCLSNRLRLMNVGSAQSGSGAQSTDISHPDIAANEAVAKARLESLIASAR